MPRCGRCPVDAIVGGLTLSRRNCFFLTVSPRVIHSVVASMLQYNNEVQMQAKKGEF
jgi:hypothetical protein